MFPLDESFYRYDNRIQIARNKESTMSVQASCFDEATEGGGGGGGEFREPLPA